MFELLRHLTRFSNAQHFKIYICKGLSFYLVSRCKYFKVPLNFLLLCVTFGLWCDLWYLFL